MSEVNKDILIDWGNHILIPEGAYHAVYVSHSTTNGTFGPKLKITFRIVTQGEHYEVLVDGWYNLKGTGEKTGKRGKVIVSRHSKFVGEMLKIFQTKIRLTRISPAMLSGHVIQINVRTVKKNSLQKTLPEILQYSTVESMECLSTATDDSELLHLKFNLNPNPKPKPISELIPT
jgi:hypothetical protein